MPKYTTLNLSQILTDFLADLLYYCFLIMFFVLAPSALLSDFLKVCQTYMTCAIYRPTYIAYHGIFHLWCVVQCIAICHFGLACRISAHNIYTLLKHSLSMMQIHIQGNYY